MSPLQYQKKIRLEEAKHMLVNQNVEASQLHLLWDMKAHLNLAENIQECLECRLKLIQIYLKFNCLIL